MDLQALAEYLQEKNKELKKALKDIQNLYEYAPQGTYNEMMLFYHKKFLDAVNIATTALLK